MLVVTRRILLALLLALNAQCMALTSIDICAENTTEFTNNAWRVLLEAYARLGYRANMVVLPSRRCLVEANRIPSRFHGLVFRTRIAEAQLSQMVRVPTPIGRIEFVAIGTQTELALDNWSQLRQLRIGALRGVLYIEGKTAGMDTTYVTSLDQLIKMLLAGRIDVAVYTPTSQESLALSLGRNVGGRAAGIRVLGTLDRLPIYHFVNSRKSEQLSGLDAQFLALTREGFIDKVWTENVGTLKAR